ncbi:class I lanthipeptide [Aquimarina longa]|nr:class I lanthipeptide [Aquimarina longa]
MKKERTLKKLDLNKLTVSKLPKEQSLKIVGGSTLGGGCKTVKGDHVC